MPPLKLVDEEPVVKKQAKPQKPVKKSRGPIDFAREKFRKFKNILKSSSKKDALKYLTDHPEISMYHRKQCDTLLQKKK